MSNEQGPVVLLVDDDVVDIEAVQRAVAQRKLNFRLIPEQDAARTIGLLRTELDAAEVKRLVVLLDINMPGMNGHQFLDAIREDEKLKSTIVFVLTTSEQESDKAKAYDRNVAGYFVKSNLNGLLDTLESYLENVEFPPVAR